MNSLQRSLLTVAALASLVVPKARAMTADELAQFLGISAWETTVALAKDSFTVSIYEIRDGKIADAWLRQGEEEAPDPKQGLQIVIGPYEGHYRLTLRSSTGTHGVVTKVPLFPQTISTSLPPKIGGGDYIIFGEPAPGAARGSDPASRYAHGFLLRVTIKTPTAAEEAKAQRSLANAKQIALACKLFAMDHVGNYPTKIEELLPDYLGNGGVFTCPLATEPHQIGYELLGGKDTNAPDTVLVQGLFTTPDGRRSVVYVNQWAALEWR